MLVASLASSVRSGLVNEVGVSFKETISTTYGEQGRAWLSLLPETMDKLCQSWDLKTDGDFSNLTFNFVAPVISAEFGKAVLKLGPHIKGRAKEASALRAYNGDSAARVLKYDSQLGALLIERLEPGLSLGSERLSEDEGLAIASRLIQRLTHSGSTAVQNDFTHISIWGLGFEKYLRENPDQTRLRREDVIRADQIFKSLVKTSKNEVLLHGDLHHANILRTANSWKAIDPKGVWGDPAFEVGAFIRNPMPELSTRPDLKSVLANRISSFSTSLKIDKKRIWGWAYSQAVLAAIWSLNEPGAIWQSWFSVASALKEVERTP